MPDCGDLVLVKQLGLKGKHKLADKWESDVYVVKLKDESLPFYTVVKENGKGKSRVIHRNHIMPITWPLVKDIGKGNENSKSLSSKQTEQVNADVMSSSSGSEDDGCNVPLSICVNVESKTSDIDINKGHPMENVIDVVSDESMCEDSCDNTDVEIDSSVDSSVKSASYQVPEKSADVTVEHKSPHLRRSSRNRRLPDRYCSDNYLSKQISVSSSSFADWKQRCLFLMDLIEKFPAYETAIIETILKIVS